MNSKISVLQPNSISSKNDLGGSFLIIIHNSIGDQENSLFALELQKKLQALNLPNLKILICEQLIPEICSQIGKANYCIFIDLCEMEHTNLKISILDACGLETSGSSVPGLEHSWLPCSLLALTHSLYAYHPTSWWFKVDIREFINECQSLCDEEQIIHNVIEQVQNLIAEKQSEQVSG